MVCDKLSRILNAAASNCTNNMALCQYNNDCFHICYLSVKSIPYSQRTKSASIRFVY